MNTLGVSNRLDPHQVRRFIGPGLGRNCLQRLSADDTTTVLPAKSDSDVMFCLQSCHGLIIDRSLEY